MILFESLSMHYGHTSLFKDVNLMLKSNSTYGLIGANGAGKTTLLKLVLGQEEPSAGNIIINKSLKIGALKQDQFKYANDRIIDIVLRGNSNLWEALTQKELLLNKDHITEQDGFKLAELETIIAENDGYIAETNAEIILDGLGIEEKHFREPLSKLSGGYKIRVLLAQCLFAAPDILLLDEPTNHLDILSIQWLENFLINTFKGILLLISHDHDFLNSTCDNILDIDYNTITLYIGNYDKFEQDKQNIAERKQHEKSAIDKRIKKDQIFIERFRAAAARARQAASREKQLKKIKVPEIQTTSRIAPNFAFQQEKKSGKEVLDVSKLCLSFKDIKLFQNLSCKIHRGEKIAILGQNGIGKSSLLKILLNIIPCDSGEIKWGYNAETTYFSQDHQELIKGTSTAFDWLMNTSNISTIEKLRGILGKMLFTQDDANKSVSILSGGEAARLLFAKIMLEKANILILDEPTNHLDLESRVALSSALKIFEGTVVFVSHDRNFVSKVATRIIFLYQKGVIDFKGTYDAFREKYSKFFEN